MPKKRTLEDAMRKLAGLYKTERVSIFPGEVVSYNEKKATCIVLGRNDVSIPDVRLQPGVCDGLLILPTAGSTVTVLKSIYNDYHVIQYSDIDKIYIRVGESQLIMYNSDQGAGQNIMFDDGSFGGLVKVVPLVNNLKAKEKDINTFKTALQTFIAGAPPANAAQLFASLVSAFSAFAGAQWQQTAQSDLENKKVQHGT